MESVPPYVGSHEDIVSTTSIKSSNVPMLKRILWLIATSQPFEPNLVRISNNLGLSKPTLYGYLDYLERAGLLSIKYSLTQQKVAGHDLISENIISSAA